MPHDPHIDVRASFRGDFDAIPEIRRSAKVAVPKYASCLSRLALQNQNAITEDYFVMAAKADAGTVYGSLKRQQRHRRPNALS